MKVAFGKRKMVKGVHGWGHYEGAKFVKGPEGERAGRGGDKERSDKKRSDDKCNYNTSSDLFVRTF